MQHDGETHKRRWRPFLAGIGLILLGAAIVALGLYLLPEWIVEELPPAWRLGVAVAVVWLPALGWTIALLRRGRRREATYAAVGALLAAIVLMATAFVLFMAALGGAMSNYG